MKAKQLLVGLLGAFLLFACEQAPEVQPSVVLNFSLIAQDDLYGSGREGIPQRGIVITSQTEWNNLKDKMNSVNSNSCNNFTEKDIDFNAYQIIVVFDKIRPSGGWSIDITDITEYPDGIVVSIRNLKQGNFTTVMTQPYHIVKIPVLKKDIQFRHIN